MVVGVDNDTVVSVVATRTARKPATSSRTSAGAKIGSKSRSKVGAKSRSKPGPKSRCQVSVQGRCQGRLKVSTQSRCQGRCQFGRQAEAGFGCGLGRPPWRYHRGGFRSRRAGGRLRDLGRCGRSGRSGDQDRYRRAHRIDAGSGPHGFGGDRDHAAAGPPSRGCLRRGARRGHDSGGWGQHCPGRAGTGSAPGGRHHVDAAVDHQFAAHNDGTARSRRFRRLGGRRRGAGAWPWGVCWLPRWGFGEPFW